MEREGGRLAVGEDRTENQKGTISLSERVINA